jgi:hypothetical protein
MRCMKQAISNAREGSSLLQSVKDSSAVSAYYQLRIRNLAVDGLEWYSKHWDRSEFGNEVTQHIGQLSESANCAWTNGTSPTQDIENIIQSDAAVKSIMVDPQPAGVGVAGEELKAETGIGSTFSKIEASFQSATVQHSNLGAVHDELETILSILALPLQMSQDVKYYIGDMDLVSDLKEFAPILSHAQPPTAMSVPATRGKQRGLERYK